MAKGKKSSSRFQARGAAPAQSFDPKKSRSNRINTAEEAFGGDEDECVLLFLFVSAAFPAHHEHSMRANLFFFWPTVHKNRNEVLFELDGRETRGGAREFPVGLCGMSY